MNDVRSRLWRDGRLVGESFPIDDLDEHLAEQDALVWVDLVDPDPAMLDKLAAELGLDRMSIEDATAPGERPKVTRHAAYSFVSVYSAKVDPTEGPDPLTSRLITARVSAFVMPRGLITVRRADSFDVEEMVKRWDENADLLPAGVGALLHGLLDTIVDEHFATVQQMDDAIEALEDGLFDDKIQTKQVQQSIYRLRKELVELRRVVLPMREVVNALLRHRVEERQTQAGAALDAFYNDLYDHVLRAAEWTESLRDMVTSLFETNLSLQDARLNTVMKKLAGWAALIAVPTLITGWYGQNVPYPGFQTMFGFWQTVVLCIGSMLGLYLLFRRYDWL